MTTIKCFSEDFKKICMNEKSEMILFEAYSKHISYSYEKVWCLVRRMLNYFSKHGIKKGDTIATILPNSPEAIVCFFSAAIAGINYAPLPCNVSEREYNNWNQLTKPIFYFVKKDVVDFDIDIEHIYVEVNGEFEWLADDLFQEEKGDSFGEPKVFLMTSGTTGMPKAMQIDVNKLWSSGIAFASEYGMLEMKPRFWNYLPMSYLGGLFNLAFIPICCKGSFVISEPFSGKTLINFWNFVKQHEINSIWFVPTIVRGLLKMYPIVGNKYNDVYKSIKYSFLGTAPIELSIKSEFETCFGIKLYENFALSESTFLTAEKDEDIRYREQNSVGKKLSYIEIKFKTVDVAEEISEIWIKTPFLFDGYLDVDGNLIRELDEEGYFNTKDLGKYNEDQVLVLAGRTRDIIKKGGLFVSLVEIENVVGNYPEVDEVTAIPIKHDFYGESYILCVILCEKRKCDEQVEKIRDKMMKEFVSYKLPERIVALDEFERTSSGKIMKNRILDNIIRG